jgi:beta-ureidopropionase
MAVGLSTVVHGIGSRRDIERNLQIVEDGIHAAVSIIGINMPVRLIALAEGALTGFTDEIFDIPHVTAARELFIDIPGRRRTGWPRWPGTTTPTSSSSARRAGPR